MIVESARADELAPALRLIFDYVKAGEREARVANALELVGRGELDPAGILVARGRQGLVGAIICLPVPGASGLVWPPQVPEMGSRRFLIEDQLLQAACRRLRQGGARLAQALLAPEEMALAEPLERNGFIHVTALWYLRHKLDRQFASLSAARPLTCQTFAECDRELFEQTLLRTYEGTLDCPEVNGVRDIAEILEGHRSQGLYRPERWWLVQSEGKPAAVLLLTEMPEGQGWDLSYVGVVPEARVQGIGKELTCKALIEAHAGQARQMTLAVDARNRPAWKMYQALGFELTEQREVYLAIWGKEDTTR